jgi:hypothetical protein
MLSSEREPAFQSLRSAVCLLLLVLLGLSLAAAGVQPFHTHEDGTRGLYNEDCPLAELAAFDDASPLPPSSPAPSIDLDAGEPVATPSDRAPSFAGGKSDSRAPPAPLA